MKSLEIVNKHIQFIDEHSTQIKGTPVMIDELQQIKQDLEVLEIIRKKDVDVAFLKTILDGYLIDGTLIIYNEESNRQQLTLEELLKLKQWLEGNENE